MADPADTEALFTAYRLEGCRTARSQLIADHLPLVHYLAGRFQPLGGAVVSREDLVAFGVLGLIDAVDRFDPGRGVPFGAFAVPRIKGAIQDELRRVDWVPRRLRRRWAALRQELGDEAVASAKGAPCGPPAHRPPPEPALRSLVSLEEWAVHDHLVVDGDSPAAAVEAKEFRRLLHDSLAELTVREQRVLVMSYEQGLTLAEIGAELGVSQGRVSQIRHHAVARLRRRLARAGVLQRPDAESAPAAFARAS